MNTIKDQIDDIINKCTTFIIFQDINSEDNISLLITNIRQLYNINNNFFVSVVNSTVLFGCSHILIDIEVLLLNEYVNINKEKTDDGHTIFSVSRKKLGS